MNWRETFNKYVPAIIYLFRYLHIYRTVMLTQHKVSVCYVFVRLKKDIDVANPFVTVLNRMNLFVLCSKLSTNNHEIQL